MSFFYVTHKGQQQGPYSPEQITSMLKENKLSWNDYLFDEQAYDWMHIMEHRLFTSDFNQSFSQPLELSQATTANNTEVAVDNVKKRQWFVLKDNANYGPFSKAELIQMLQGKTLFEYDFIWKEGMESWKRVSEEAEFSSDNIKNTYQLMMTSVTRDVDQAFFRRRHVRAQLNTRIIIHDQKKVYNSNSEEISEGGASFHVPEGTFSMGQQLYLHFSPGKNLPQFNVISKVVSQRGSLYGVQFIKISGVAKSFISKYAESFKKAA